MFMTTTSFGVEIEFCGITREHAGRALANYFGYTANYVGGAYKAWEVRDNQCRTWSIMRDASIDAYDDYKCELVTPVLSGDDDVELMQGAIRVLRKAGAKVNASCGIHVHVSHKDMTADALRRLAISWAGKENCIYETLNVGRNRENDYCRKTDERFLTKLRKTKNVSYANLQEMWYNGDSSWAVRQHYHGSRYHSLNLHSFFQHKNVEFRCFNSTLHAGKVKAYVQFCLATVHYAVTKKSVRYQVMPSKRANLADWFVRIGLVGEKYKTCRQHMISGLAA